MPRSRPDPARLRCIAVEFVTCLRFYTRMPIPALPIEAATPPQPFARVLRWAPLAGVAVGAVGAATLAISRMLGLLPLVAATLALLATIIATGGLHEDGLADVADGFGGGATVTRKLEIMRDSRLGTYGALAVGASLLLRAAALAGLLERHGLMTAMAALVASAALSRGFGLLPLAMLAPARPDGLSRSAGRLAPDVVTAACVLSVVIGVGLPLLAGSPLLPVISGTAFAAGAACGTAALARRQIGGHTGDVAGAAQQVGEIAFLLGLLVRFPTD